MPRRAADRFTIASFPQPVQLDPNFAETTWATLEHAITEINKRNTSNLSFEKLYRYSYNMVLHKHGEFLYSRLTRLQTEHLQGVAALIRAADAPAFLPELLRQWSWFELSLAHVRDVLMYMDRHYVKARQQKTVYELGISLFRDVVVSHSSILPRLSQTLLTNIDRERNGEAIDAPLMRSVTRMLAQLGEYDSGTSVYASVFEDSFLDRTRQFYAREATLYLSETTCSDYLRKASQRMTEERVRVETYLESQTAPKVRAVAERELLSRYMNRLIDMDNSGLVSMLRHDRLSDLRLMYTLFREIDDGEDAMRATVKREVLERGTEIVRDAKHAGDPVSMIGAVLSLKEKYEFVLRTALAIPGTQGGALGAISGSSASHVGGSSAGMMSVVGGSTGMVIGLHGGSSLAGEAGGSLGVGATGGVSASAFVGGAGNTVGSASSGVGLSSVVDGTVYTRDFGAGSSSSSGGASASAAGGASSSGVAVPKISITVGDADKKFVSSVNEAFERFLNSFAEAAEYLSLYVDKLLRKDFKGSSDDEVESKLDSVMTLFRYLHEKDAFQRYYQQHLTKRLLHTKAVSSDAERSFIAKMKMGCGYMYTSKMEVMFNDVKTSEETTAAFKERVETERVNMHGVDVSVSVLTTMSWPISKHVKMNLPIGLRSCVSRFEEFYYGKHEGRVLTWHTELATADVRGRFGLKRGGGAGSEREYDFASVPAYLMCILMLFNDSDTMTCKEILEATEIPEGELTRHLQSLSLAKYRVLRKEPREKEVKLTDRFSVNDDFTSKSRRIKLQVVSARKEDETEKSQTRSRIDDDRRPVIDTVIVRVMKSRKVLEHNKLIVEVTNMLSSRFEPNPVEIKKRIESLVEREYLERQQDKRQIYQYVA